MVFYKSVTRMGTVKSDPGVSASDYLTWHVSESDYVSEDAWMNFSRFQTSIAACVLFAAPSVSTCLCTRNDVSTGLELRNLFYVSSITFHEHYVNTIIRVSLVAETHHPWSIPECTLGEQTDCVGTVRRTKHLTVVSKNMTRASSTFNCCAPYICL